MQEVELFTAPTEGALVRFEGEGLLEYTQRIREKMITQMTKGGISTEVKDVIALTSVLNDLDKQEFSKARIALEEDTNKSDKEAMALIAATWAGLGNKNPFEAVTPVEREVSTDILDVSSITLVPGELDHTPRQLNYDNFTKEHKRKNPNTKIED